VFDPPRYLIESAVQLGRHRVCSLPHDKDAKAHFVRKQPSERRQAILVGGLALLACRHQLFTNLGA
jgi:hypothetical protein